MDLVRPDAFWLLVPWAGLLAWTIRGRRRRLRDWKDLGQPGRPPGDGALVGLLATLLIVVAIARPGWGDDPGGVLPPGRDVVLLIDVSRSMAAEDAVPSRIGVAIEAATSLIGAIAEEPGDRVGVVAFSGAGVVRCGLTENLGAVAEIVGNLRPGSVRPGGTDLGAGLEVAAGAFDNRDHAEGRMIVVFTDGEDHPGGWRGRAGSLREAGIVVNAVAIGDPDQGQPVPGGEGKGALTYRGAPVASKRTDEPLDEVAGETGGVVVRLGLATADLGSLYKARIAPAARRLRHAVEPPRRAERFGLFLVAALAMLTFGGRPKPSRRSARWAGLVLVAVAAVGASPAGESARTLIGRGRTAYQGRDFAAALVAFERAAEAAPASPIPRFDAGASLYALGRYDEAIERYREARDRGDPAFRVKVDYALGNAALLGGDPAGAIGHYDACLASTRRSTTLDAIRRDAEANRAYARDRLKADSPPDAPEPDEPPPGGTPKPASTPPPAPGDGDGPDGDGPRGPGGAGGSDPDQRPRDGRSPQDRLDEALAHVRDALKNRPPDRPLPSPPGEGKDW